MYIVIIEVMIIVQSCVINYVITQTAHLEEIAHGATKTTAYIQH